MISFVVYGDPVPQARPRFARTGHAYEPEKCKEYKRRVAVAATAAMGARAPLAGAVMCSITFHVRIPKSLSRKRREELAGTHPAKKPDIDNMAKAVMDAMNGIVWIDDAQVCVMAAEKRYSEMPKAVVKVEVAMEHED